MESPRPTAQEQHFPSAMRAAEERLIADRRATAASLPESSASPRPQIGLALSGGGIRSATLSLGLVQVLARRDLLPHVDYLSTVSGGGYLGSFVGSLFARRGLPGGYQPAAEEPGARHAYVKQVLSEERPAPLAWLRQNGRYLTPNGSGDVLLAIAVALRNWIAVLVVMLTAALTIALGSHLVLGGIDALVGGFAPPEWKAIISGPHWIGDWLWWSPWFLAPVAVIALFAVPTGWAYWLVPMMHSKEGSWNWLNVTLPSLVTLITAVVSLLVAITGSGGETSIPPWLVTTCWVTGVIASLTLIYFLLVSLLTRKPVVYRSRISSWNAKALGLIVGLSLCALIDTFGRTLYAVWITEDMWPWLVGAATALGGVFTVMRHFSPGTSTGTGKSGGIPLRVVAGVVGVVFHLGMLSCISAVSYGIAYHGEVPAGDPGHRLIAAETITVPLVTDGDGRVRAQMPAPNSMASTVGTVSSAPAEASTSSDRASSKPASSTSAGHPHLLTVAIAGGIGLVMSMGYAFITSFVNESSLAHTYGSRLTRSYLGATNPERQDLPVDSRERRVTNAMAGDDLLLRPAPGAPDAGYQPHLNGGPLHLINITINETVDGRSGIQQLDRKGVALAVGPAGVSVSVGHHAQWNSTKEQAQKTRDTYYLTAEPRPKGAWTIFEDESQAEALTVGQLIGISGAAFSTGIGSQTSVALSLLCGLFNIRTGHWWQSGTKGPFSAFPFVQHFVLSEWLARFPGTAWNYWYLSDGGHFENLACYELIRRRVPFIICCDHGEDPKGALEDLGGLVRKARMDFCADLTFLSRAEAHALITPALRGIIGGLDDLRLTPAMGDQPAKPPLACAAIGRLRYADGTTGTMLLIKPGLIGGEPEDVRYYQRSHATFPHEPTLNQFFDEAQWESYRRLGEFMAEQLLGHDTKIAGWNPARLRPLDD